MDPAYDPQKVEADWYSRWESAGIFRPEQNPGGPPYCIVIPPPNVTGSLHMGHALNMAIQDALIRRKRMQGYAALWVPGTDHAGIATQNVVERQLAGEGLTRHHLGREAFIERVWEWKQRFGGRIFEQMRRLGFSCDWSRERFTMDEGLSRAVRTVFVRLYEEGIIYRGRRVINWCPRCHTALSDIEVEHEDVTGELVYIEYPFAEGEGGIEVATTRAETMLGDTAVAVHPDDERYRALIGRMLRLPLMGREIPIVGDPAVDPDFGTGAVKVTPAHDPTDFEIAQRAGLPAITILDEGAVVTAAGGPFAGMDRFDARVAVKEALAEAGVLRRIEEHPHAVGHCYRCGTAVEPYLSEQWFVKVRPLVEPAIAAVQAGEVRFVPPRWEKHYLLWMENLRDWTISRQIWWGHRIPAWYCDSCGEITVATEDPAACACGSTALRREEDVLDTWFSSALWPFSTLGWPDDTADLRAFYPNAVLVTAYDIIYFWVARMIQMGLHFVGGPPFADVAIHGLIQAPDKRKMSKSLGNAIDPLDLVAEHGADPLRLALVLNAVPGHDTVPFQPDQVDAARRFGNKLWNAVRFALRHTEAEGVPASGGYPEAPSPEERWILSRLHEVSARFDEMFDEYRLNEAYGLLYTFAWGEVCDWSLELAKAPLRGDTPGTVARTLGVVLRDLLALLHPIMPFLTEELWSHLVGEGFIAGATWPRPPAYEAPEGFAVFQELVGEIRRFRAEHGLAPRHPLEVVVADPAGIAAPWWQAQLESLAAVAPQWAARPPDGGGRTRLVAGPLEAFVSLAGAADNSAERERLARAVADAEALLAASEAKLANPQFVDRAPAPVVEKERARAAETAARLAKLRAQLDGLGSGTDYASALACLDRHAGRGVKPGTARIAGLLSLMGDPHRSYPAIHVAGSNGKTTTARLAAGLLAAHGLKPGLFTSPHLQAVEERFEVAGEALRREDFGAALDDVLPFVAAYEERTGDGITYFELTAALAFSWFAARTVDAAVIEVGLGGRLDATNVLEAEVAAITSISLEHTEYLGTSEAAIAAEKAAILFPGRTLVTGNLPPAALEVAGRRAADTGSTWLRMGTEFSVADATRAVDGWLVDIEGVYGSYPELALPLRGRHQTGNLAVAVAAVEAFFGRALDLQAVAEAVASVRSPGRMELVRRNPLVLLDGAHNPEGSEALAASLAEEFATTRWAVVFGAMADKDVPAMLRSLAPAAASFHAARAGGTDRALPATAVGALASETMAVPISTHDSVAAAVAAALEAGGPVLVTGSLYVVGEARGALGLGPSA